VKYLPQYGWQPLILTPENPDFDLKDPGLLLEIPPEVLVFREPVVEPTRMLNLLKGKKGRRSLKQGVVFEQNRKSSFDRILTWIRGNVFVPDPRIWWKKTAVKQAMKIIDAHHPEIIITTGPPHSMHLIGLEVKQRTGIRWLADFRDPWSEWDMLEKLLVSAPALRKHRKLEKQVLQKADLLLTVSNNWAARLSHLAGKKVEVITNGFDPADFKAAEADFKPKKFTITHAGLLNEFRNVPVFWQVLASLCQEYKEFENDLEVVLAGIVSQKLKSDLRQHPVLSAKVKILDYLPHETLGKYYRESSLLLLILNQSANAAGHLPGKLFEYLNTGRAILCFSPEESDAAAIIRETGTGSIVDPENAEQIRAALLEHYEGYLNGTGQVQPKGVERFSRVSTTARLVKLLEHQGHPSE
jgi:glycosyltransferase involved in cell wall biosynthesis